MSRTAGILLPITSLPSRYGIGCFSESAYKFVDWLKGAGQCYWQILPLVPTSYGDSPYQSFSTYAGNPYFIDPRGLHKLGYVTEEELAAAGVPGDLVRMSCGIENAQDLIDDILQALDKVQ